MLPRANIRLAITGALLVILLGSLHGCTSDPLAPPAGDDCILINGTLYCD
jgi:hypothetical protein